MITQVFLIVLVTLVSIISNGLFNTVSAGEKSKHNIYPITDFELMEDAGGQYSIDTIRSPGFTNQFKQYPHEVISLGITKSVYWIRFQLPPNDPQTMTASQLLQFKNPNIDKIDLFIPIADQNAASGLHYLTRAVGVSRPAASRDVLDNTWVFSIPDQYRQDQFLYLRLESSSALRLPVVLWRENSFITEAFLKNIGFGIFYGILLAMLFFNLFIFFVLRDKAYLFYVLYIGFMLLYQFQVHGYLRLWLDISYELYNAIFWVWLAAAFISSIYFTHHFLQVRSENTLWNKIRAALLVTALLQGILGVCGYNIWANQIAHGLGLAGPLVIMVLAVFRLRQGFRPARFYLLAWGVLSIGIVVWVLAAYIPDTFSAVNYLLVATACESILLSFALSDRFKTLRLKEAALTKNMQYYRDLSLTDELTGLYNKRYLTELLGREVDTALQDGRLLTLMVIDIDHFKTYNDSYGHWQGDQVLIRLGNVLLNELEKSQPAFRYGGEEFVVLLPNTNCDDAIRIADGIREKIQTEEFTLDPNVTVTVTASVGLAELTCDDNAEKLFQRADEALYKAKAAGRNQVACL
ncbi:sensor domain-containing diguanylate cyclase [Sporomusa malonica]|uniref:Diguanylate cyclase (GGDEF) domain-containing protein n=1 Tax=Sporomusa malonica TaxID=112901 RepID=A0A1W2CVW4_9FIRM|nr:diguanylate cyclase [Sporomusa malonica]SMC89375.1 diguanylate cyclase (GGDEF) domain-containing protein [Sporomusa malonica]